MLAITPTMELLERAVEVSALKQSVYAANIANANVDGYRRMEVSFDRELERVAMQMANSQAGTVEAAFSTNAAQVVSTNDVVKLDEEMGLMAKNALTYQTLLGAYEKSLGLLRVAIKEGRE